MIIFRKFKISGLVLVFLAALSCDPWFSFSPYEAELDAVYRGNRERNLSLIDARDAGDSKPFKVAVISDPHYHFSKLQDAVLHINRAGDYEFVVVVGDLTENGLMQEFIFFHQIMSNLKIPYVTVIGNHDYLSNGEMVYKQMYGPYNYSFVFNNVKLVMFDNITYESEKQPDMKWFAKALANDNGYDHVIPVSHIPPYDGQMTNQAKIFHALMVKKHIPVSLHGHKHDFSITKDDGGVQYVTVSSPQHRAYTELSITPTNISIRKIEY